MASGIQYQTDGSFYFWNAPTATYSECGPDGTVRTSRPFTPAEVAAYPPDDPSAVDLLTVADQVTQLTDAVNLLILSQLGM